MTYDELEAANNGLHGVLDYTKQNISDLEERVKTLEDALIYLGRTAQRHHSRIIEQALAAKDPK